MILTEINNIKVDMDSSDYDPGSLASTIASSLSHELPEHYDSRPNILSQQEIRAVIELMLVQMEISET